MSIISCNLHSAGQVHVYDHDTMAYDVFPPLCASYLDGRDVSAMTLKTTLSMFTFICFVQRRTVSSFAVLFSTSIYVQLKGKARCRSVLQTPPSNSMIVRVLLWSVPSHMMRSSMPPALCLYTGSNQIHCT